MGKLEFTDKDEVEYLQRLVKVDMELYKRKFERRKKIWVKIKFDQETWDFH